MYNHLATGRLMNGSGSRLRQGHDNFQRLRRQKARTGGGSDDFGLVLGTVNSHPVMWHNGGIAGFTTEEMIFLDAGFTLVVSTNYDGVDPHVSVGVIAVLVVQRNRRPVPAENVVNLYLRNSSTRHGYDEAGGTPARDWLLHR